MPKYTVSGVISADCHLGEVDAACATEAIDKAWDELQVDSPPICHQCAQHMNIGDVYRLIVCNVDDHKDTAESE